MNTVDTGVFSCQSNVFYWITSTRNSNSNCSDDQDYPFAENSWSLLFGEISLDYDDKLDRSFLGDHTFSCLHSVGFCEPALKHPKIIVWIFGETCLIFQLFDFIGRMCKLNKGYWLETDDFLNSINLNTEKIIKSLSLTVFPYTNLTLGTNTQTLSQLELFLQKNTFCMELTQMHTTQFFDLIVTSHEVLNRNVGNKNPRHFGEEPSFTQTWLSSP